MKLSTSSHSFKILSLNAFIRPPFITSHWKGDYKDERIETLIEEIIPKYDLICFQEFFRFGSNRRQDFIKRILENPVQKQKPLQQQQEKDEDDRGLVKEGPRKEKEQRTFKDYFALENRNLWKLKIDGGLLVVSKRQINEKSFLTFVRGVHSDWLAAKGALYVQIDLNERGSSSSTPTKLHVFTTHLQASYEPEPIYNSPASNIRHQQLKQLKDFILSTLTKEMTNSKNRFNVELYGNKSDIHHQNKHIIHKKKKDLVLVMGDFNMNGLSRTVHPKTKLTEYQEMLSLLNDQSLLKFTDIAQDKNEPTTTNLLSTDEVEFKERLDYCFLVEPVFDGSRHEENDTGVHNNYLFLSGSNANRKQENEGETIKNDEQQFVNFKVDCLKVEGKPFIHLSDHCGLEIEISFPYASLF